MLWEILLILVALPILEGIGWLIADAIEARVTWKQLLLFLLLFRSN